MCGVTLRGENAAAQQGLPTKIPNYSAFYKRLGGKVTAQPAADQAALTASRPSSAPSAALGGGLGGGGNRYGGVTGTRTGVPILGQTTQVS